MKNILFVCSKNKLRSPTAEAVFAEYEGFNVRSAGLNHDAEISLTPEMVEWADCIFAMEKAHKSRLQKRFKQYIRRQQVICLDIPDNYGFMAKELVLILKNRLEAFFHTA